MVTVGFDDSFITNVWSFHHIIILIYINGVCFRKVANLGAVVTLLMKIAHDFIKMSPYMNVYLQHNFFGSHLERKCTFKNPTVGGKGMHGETVQEWKPQI